MSGFVFLDQDNKSIYKLPGKEIDYNESHEEAAFKACDSLFSNFSKDHKFKLFNTYGSPSRNMQKHEISILSTISVVDLTIREEYTNKVKLLSAEEINNLGKESFVYDHFELFTDAYSCEKDLLLNNIANF